MTKKDQDYIAKINIVKTEHYLNMKLLFLFIIKQFYDIGYKLHLLSPHKYRQLKKTYYREKMEIYSFWHNLCAKKRGDQYFSAHSKKSDKVIYTCIIGDYDQLLAPNYINSDYDYICFTDSQEMIQKKYVGPWEIMPLQFSQLNNSQNNRWHKMHPHILFPNYQTSIYIDANINFKTDKIYKYINALPDNCFIALPRHAKRDCIYEEAISVIENELDTPEKVNVLLNKYRKEGFPPHFGLAENNVIYRRHNNPECIKLMNEWWNIFLKYSQRDQLTLFYLFWKNKINFTFFDHTPFKKDHKNFRIYKHKG